MPTEGLWVGGYGVDTGTASHSRETATPMVHQGLVTGRPENGLAE